LLLAACGGGGGGGGGSIAVPPATPTPTPGPITKAQARASMQSTLAVVANSNGPSLTGASTLAIMRKVQAIYHGRRPQAVAGCNNGYTSTVVYGATSSTQTDNYYYDAQCTLLEETDVIIVPNSATLQNLTATGSVTTYARNGSVTGYTTLSLSLTGNSTQDQLTLVATVYPAPGTQPSGKIGVSCIAPPSGTSFHCGDALVTYTGPQQVGVSMDDALSQVTSGSTTTVTSTATVSAYEAASGLDIQQGTLPAWSVIGAAPIASVSGTVTLTSTNATITGGSVTISDATDGITIAGTFSSSSVTITATGRGATIASVTVDLAGNGIITYADGTTATITAWTITG
jgi:hypothetical protein